MEITLNITEDSKVELVKDSCEAVQGENNVTILKINFPSTIKGYSIDNYTKQIEFGECKELGECVKFFDVLEGNTYKLCSTCTQFKKLMIQFTLKNLVDEAEPIVWKTIPFALEFCESINAENTKQVQVALLSMAEILTEWENYIKANTFRVINKVGDVPTADATSLGDTIFYLGANSTSPYTLTYGHYYRCNFVNDVYEWTDLTQDPSLEGVANGIREINNNQSMQLWVGTKEELKNETTQDNVIYIPEDHDMTETFDEILTEMAEKNDGVLKVSDTILPRKKLVWEKDKNHAGGSVYLEGAFNVGEKYEINYFFNNAIRSFIFTRQTTDTELVSDCSIYIMGSQGFTIYTPAVTISNDMIINKLMSVTFNTNDNTFIDNGYITINNHYLVSIYKIIE